MGIYQWLITFMIPSRIQVNLIHLIEYDNRRNAEEEDSLIVASRCCYGVLKLCFAYDGIFKTRPENLFLIVEFIPVIYIGIPNIGT